ncbi:MAG: hypothetical protein SOX30_00765 [Lachnospiraceae bacterium]|nr:hypothetical protein [Lachnospiraceae bacterium]
MLSFFRRERINLSAINSQEILNEMIGISDAMNRNNDVSRKLNENAEQFVEL